jgi:uncharacterized cupin superfamily protein
MMNAVLRRVLSRFDRFVFGGVPTVSTHLPAEHQALPSAPVPPEWVRAGRPQASALQLTRSPDGGLVTGVWECTPGRFRWYFACDEVVVILRGRGTVRVGEIVHRLEPGASVYFPIGTDSEWEIESTVRKHFTHRFPTPLAHRLLSPS